MRLSVNGQPRDACDGASVADLVGDLVPGTTRGVAVAVNGAVVPRTEWSTTALDDGDAVEVLTATQGG